jgi:AraC family transcriptional regulator
MWQEKLWEVALDHPPTVFNCSYGMHGDHSRERYRLDGLWCIHFYRYVGEAVIGGETFPIRPGYISVTPPDTDLEHRWMHPRSEHISVHFRLTGSDTETRLPAMQDVGDRFAVFYAQMEEAIQWFPKQRQRSASKVWDTLWQLSDAQPLDTEPAKAIHPAVRKTLQAIERRLNEPLSVALLAEQVDLSHSHLTRLFHGQTGQTVAGYIVSRRAERAKYLLTYSTLPIKAVAAQVGLPDLQVFNKTLRRQCGASPRQLRRAQPGI